MNPTSLFSKLPELDQLNSGLLNLFQQSLFQLPLAAADGSEEIDGILPVQASEVATSIDSTYWFITYVCVFFFVLVVGLMAYFTLRYRRKDPNEPFGTGSNHSTALEIAWTVPPTILVMIMFWMGFKGYMAMTEPPADAIQVNVLAKRWDWTFGYPDVDGVESGSELHTYLGEPFVFNMNSTDVMHALSIPAMRVKRDVNPRRTERLWFTPIKEGTFDIYCAEYCGKDHSRMRGRITVHANREKWKEAIYKSDVIPATLSEEWKQGLWVIKRKGCLSCHAVDSDKDTAQYPSWTVLSRDMANNKTRTFEDGSSQKIDRDYLIRSVEKPGAQVVKGFGNQMPSSSFRDRERLFKIVTFIEQLHKLDKADVNAALDELNSN